MKERVFAVAAVCAMLFVASFAYIPEAKGGGLECDDLTGCRGRAGCGGKGSASGCSITCADGATIECPKEIVE